MRHIFQKKFFSRRAGLTIEYMALIVFFLAVLLAMRTYIVQGLMGKWKAAGDTFGLGRQYDPRPFGATGEEGGTLECYYEEAIRRWVDRKAAEAKGCDCSLEPDDPQYAMKCIACSISAVNPYCFQ